MNILIRLTSEQDIYHSDEYPWPSEVPLALPGIGDRVELSAFGSRVVKSKNFTYNLPASRFGQATNHLIVDVVCD